MHTGFEPATYRLEGDRASIAPMHIWHIMPLQINQFSKLALKRCNLTPLQGKRV